MKMFNKTRRKIIAAVMASLILLLAITLCVIYISSYSSIRSRDREMLKRYAEMYTLENKLNEAEPAFPDAENPTNGIPLEEIGENGQKPAPPEGPSENMRGRNERIFDLSTFYSVAFSDSGEVLYVDRGKTELFAEDELIELAEEILAKGKAEGEISGLMYVKTDKHNCTLVAFMDNTVSKGSMNTLLRYTLIAGGAAIVVLFFISRMLAKRIVKPLEENDERQKQFVSDAGHELKTPVADRK
ncbi:MAG: sensor histidine kinase, partial [Firmicutes bacterium]|nr:sensor histidine kinase [Bacillota bacterium]